jgi:hypothetical protein
VVLDDTPPITVSSTFDHPAIEAGSTNATTERASSTGGSAVVATTVVSGVVSEVLAAVVSGVLSEAVTGGVSVVAVGATSVDVLGAASSVSSAHPTIAVAASAAQRTATVERCTMRS